MSEEFFYSHALSQQFNLQKNGTNIASAYHGSNRVLTHASVVISEPFQFNVDDELTVHATLNPNYYSGAFNSFTVTFLYG